MLYPMVPLTLLSVWLSCPRLFDRLPRWLCRAGAAVVGAGAAVVLAVMVLMGIQAGAPAHGGGLAPSSSWGARCPGTGAPR